MFGPLCIAMQQCLALERACSDLAMGYCRWDYDVSYSYLLGAMINSPRFLAEPERFGPWSYVKSVVFYPSIIDTERECRPPACFFRQPASCPIGRCFAQEIPALGLTHLEGRSATMRRRALQ